MNESPVGGTRAPTSTRMFVARTLIALEAACVWFVVVLAVVSMRSSGDAAQGLGMGAALLALWVVPLGSLLGILGIVLASTAMRRSAKERTGVNRAWVAVGGVSLVPILVFVKAVFLR